jgi:general secretion pathway protein A
MYTAFYGLREKPFSLTPNPRFLYLADSHREAMAHLLYGLEQGEGFIVITGEVGTGKTTLCRSLLDRIPGDTEIAILFNPSRSANELLQSINEEFGLPAEAENRRQLLSSLNRFLLAQHAASRRVVLIIDEAQNLAPATLEQVRLLSNLETESSKLIQIILLGQPELDAKLDSDSLRQLRQRISVRWRLEALAANDTAGYVRHRLAVAAGADRDVLSDGALREIHRLTGGVPRLINVLADRSLLAGYSVGAHRVGAHVVRRAAREVPGTERQARAGRRRVGIGFGLGIGLATAAALALAFVPWTSLERAVGGSGPASVDAAPPPPGWTAGASSGSGEPATHTAASSATPGSAAAVIVVPPPSAAPLRDEEAWVGLPTAATALVQPVETDDRFEPDGQGAFLAALLTRQDAAAARATATTAVLERFGEPPLVAVPESFDDLADALARRDLVLTEHPSADLALLVQFDQPALIPLRSTSGELYVVALVGVDRGVAELSGVGPSGSLRVPLRAVEEQWIGEAWIVWRPYLEIPEVIALGDDGPGVLWVQEALQRLGDSKADISGRYDTQTLEGVRRFQIRHGLEGDGVTGPLTQMLLFGELDEYSPPRLEGDAG